MRPVLSNPFHTVAPSPVSAAWYIAYEEPCKLEEQ